MTLRAAAETDAWALSVAAVPGGFVSATTRAVTRWEVDGDRLRGSGYAASEDDVHGPLVWLPDLDALGWGPVVVEAGQAAWSVEALLEAAVGDLGPGAPGAFHLVSGAVRPDGLQAAIAVERPRVRVVASRGIPDPAVLTRVSVLDMHDHRPGPARTLAENGDLPNSMAYAGHRLLLGGVGSVRAGGEVVVDLDEYTAARSLAVASSGAVAAGTASGRVVTPVGSWVAHAEPVVALAYSATGAAIASGSADRTMAVWSATGDELERYDAGGEVVGVAWLDEDTLVAAVGGTVERLVVLRTG